MTLALGAPLGEARRTSCGRSETLVAPASPSAARHDQLDSMLSEVNQRLGLRILDSHI